MKNRLRKVSFDQFKIDYDKMFTVKIVPCDVPLHILEPNWYFKDTSQIKHKIEMPPWEYILDNAKKDQCTLKKLYGEVVEVDNVKRTS